MTKSKTTKRALLSSAMALLLCFTMLLGTTFAWFTDSAASGSNVITAGNLDMEVSYTLDGTTWNKLDGATDLFKKGLWEPGHTEVVLLKITNNGSLALKYAANMNIVNETVGKTKDNKDIVLSEILTVSTCTQQYTDSNNNIASGADIFPAMTFNGADGADGWIGYQTTSTFKAGNVLKNDKQLQPQESDYIAVKVDMAESVGNEANHNGVNIPTINFGINVLATQFTYENDSFGNQYDKDAVYEQTAKTFEELRAALANGGNIVIEDDIVLTEQLTITKDVTIDLNDNELKANMTESLDGVYDTLIRIENGATVSIYGNGTANIADGVGRWIRCVYGATINIYGGNWIQESNDFDASKDPQYCEGIYANEKGNVNIYGGTFKFNTVPYYTLNESRGGQIFVYGGTFINFDPSKSSAGDGSYVAEGYKVVSETKDNGDVWYTVVAE